MTTRDIDIGILQSINTIDNDIVIYSTIYKY